MKHVLIILCSVLGLVMCSPVLLPSTAEATEGPSSTGASYLTLPVGAKSIAMGEVKAALIGDPFNWVSNPGAFKYTRGYGIGLLHAEWILDTRYNNLVYNHRLSDMIALGGGVVYTYRPDIQGYDELGVATKKLKNNNYQILLGLGFTPVQSFTAGINIKYFQEKLDEWTAGGMGVDIGALYTFEEVDISVGFVAQNLGPDITFEELREPLPLTVRLGASHSFSVVEDNIGFTYAFDLVKPRYESIYICVGAEMELYKSMAVRVGYNGQEYRPGEGLTLGGGVKVRERIELDYAWTPYGDLGSFHRISMFFAMR